MRYCLRLWLTLCGSVWLVAFFFLADPERLKNPGDLQTNRVQIALLQSRNLQSAKPTQLDDSVATNGTGQLQTEAKQHMTDLDHMSWSYEIGCHNIDEVKTGVKLGNGVTKSTFQATFKNHPVVVKMITANSKDISQCLKKSRQSREQCSIFPRMKLMKEILMAQQLNHPNIISLRGYCLRNEGLVEHKNGLVAVYEKANRLSSSAVKTWPVKRRLRVAYEITDLFEYLETNPLGSLVFPDFKFDHFMLVGDRVKIIDLDDMQSSEPDCKPGGNICRFDLPCINNICRGANAKHNLQGFDKILASHLIPTNDPSGSVSSKALANIREKLHSLGVNATELKTLLAHALEPS